MAGHSRPWVLPEFMICVPNIRSYEPSLMVETRGPLQSACKPGHPDPWAWAPGLEDSGPCNMQEAVERKKQTIANTPKKIQI